MSETAVILEGLVTTLGPDGDLNIAPMGPTVEDASLSRFLLRPFPTSRTYRNLAASGEGVLHVTDDVLLLARASIGTVTDAPTRPADVVRGRILTGACRYVEFRVRSIDDREERVRIEAEAVTSGTLRDFFGFNRAKHAVLEAAILATRVALLPRAEILAEFDRHAVIVGKTGGPAEREALELLRNHVMSQGPNPGPGPEGTPR